jgi:hypothetical protein
MLFDHKAGLISMARKYALLLSHSVKRQCLMYTGKDFSLAFGSSGKKIELEDDKFYMQYSLLHTFSKTRCSGLCTK